MGERGVRRLLVVVVAMVVVAAGCRFGNGLGPPSQWPVPPLANEGRWFTDATGRVVTLRGVNFVQKWAPNTPEAAGFDRDDAELIASSGLNTVRLGVVWEFLMPAPGEIDEEYLESIARTVRILGKHGLYVLLDFHQDGYGPATHGNGMPPWATLTDGLPNPPDPFPTYYVTNPALQRAFDNFWANKAGPDGVPLQTHYATAMQTVAKRFVWSRNVIGYEAMNEPWPGTNWQSCVTGCPDLEQQLLVPFHQRMTEAVRAVDRRRPVYVEPFVLFNFGTADTSLPGGGSTNALSTHAYALDTAANAAVMDRSIAAAERDGAPVIVTEWGATTDAAQIEQFGRQFEERNLSSLFWSYAEQVVHDSTQPIVPPNLNLTVLTGLTRPYAPLVNGTPTTTTFDSSTRVATVGYSTTRPDGRRASHWRETVVVVPKLRYPDGYRVSVTGAEVTSHRCARTLTLRNHHRAEGVSVTITPATNCR